ncbi:MAG: hypothetical protein E6H04_04575 [Bacillati bacterium ANGP1]|uniref:ZU5 domain-containing protein n=1 Tax=Candidatus Segetimicrobium genomatis TaxID=2569760 RepID=A0A537JG94_9BACT|nr:MAG: hypothetical protein E6H04_04575 [Terrabacteria group bacterium ANGP1]
MTMRVVERAPRARWVTWGVTAALAYIGAVAVAWPVPVRLLYDGLAPLPPYRWVHPPAERASDNQAPQLGTGTITFGPSGSRAAEVATGDDQALVTFPQSVIAPRSGAPSVKVVITPLDPATVAPAPNGQRFDGNAYRIEANYATSAEPVILSGPVTVVLRYPVHGTLVCRFTDPGWKTLPTNRFDGSQQVLANSDGLGIFVAATAR